MAEKESQRADGIDFVTIVTPNNVHYEAAKAFLEKGIHVLCEKPLCFEIAEAEELKKIAAEKNLLFCVNYSYSGNNMVKEARQLILNGHIGRVINVNAAFGNIYQAWTGALLKLSNGETLEEKDLDFPNIDAGMDGVRFIHACIESNANDAAWVNV